MDIKKIMTFSFSGIITTGLLLICLHSEPSRPSAPHHLTTCSIGIANKTLVTSNDPMLKKLADYQTLCGGQTTTTAMIFAPMPTSPQDAETFAYATATKLNAFAEAHITPLVSFEPSLADPDVINNTSGGVYDEVLKIYFDNLKNLGISDRQMGKWILFPEANTPTWHNTDPATFAINIERVGSIIKPRFPHTHLTILLNSRTYASDDTSWNHGELKSLTSYVSSMPKGMIDSFGYQGFPTVSAKNATTSYSQLDSKDFLPYGIAKEAAELLGVKDIWLNTGTFRQIYTNDPKATVTATPEERAHIFTGILDQAKSLKATGQTVTVNIFAKDKSNDSEQIDWSYWKEGNVISDPHAAILKSFLISLRENDLGVSLYDSF